MSIYCWNYSPIFSLWIKTNVCGFLILFVCFDFLFSLLLDYHGNVHMYASVAIAKVSVRSIYRIVCPLGIFCDSFVNAVFLVWYFIFIMKFFCTCHYAWIWSLSVVLAAEKQFSDVWKFFSNPILGHDSCGKLFHFFICQGSKDFFHMIKLFGVFKSFP